MEIIHRDNIVDILSFLRPSELCKCSLVSKRFWDCAKEDKLWQFACECLWENKIYIPHKAKELRRLKRAKQAFRFSVADSKRKTITAAELTGLEWYFRFKYDAGEVWTHGDPFWNGGEARKVRFAPDRTVVFHEGMMPRMTWELMRYRDMARNFPELKFPADEFSEGYPIMQVEDFPPKTVLRHPENWGFILHSTWVIYTSFKMSARNVDKYTRDHRLTKQLYSWQWAAAAEYNEIVGMTQDDD